MIVEIDCGLPKVRLVLKEATKKRSRCPEMNWKTIASNNVLI